MEITEFVKKTELVPMADLSTLAAQRGAFGDDVLAGFATQVQLRSSQAQAVLDTASQANRDTLLASEQRSYDTAIRERDAVLGLQRAIEQRTEQRAFVPESQRQPSKKEKRGGLFGLALRDLKESAAPGSVIAPDDWSANFFDKLSAESVAIKSGIRVVRTMRDVLHVPRIDSDPAANWTAEAAPITASDPAYTGLVATPRKLATLTVISNELIADSNPDVIALLEQQVTRALALKLDLGVFEGSGVAPEIRGLKNTPGIVTNPLGAVPTNLDAFAAAITALESNNAKATAIVTSPEAWGGLLTLKEGAGSNKGLLQDSAGSGGQAVPRSLYGVPVFVTSQLTAGDAYVYDGSQVVLVMRQDTTIAVDSSRLFNSDQSELRSILRADLVVANVLAVVHISGLTAVAGTARGSRK
jgi:HK97 family phage major capsid protein